MEIRVIAFHLRRAGYVSLNRLVKRTGYETVRGTYPADGLYRA